MQQLSALWKRTIAGATGLTALVGLALGYSQLGWPTLAWSTDVAQLQTQIDKVNQRIDGIDKLNLYRERDRVEDKIDELQERYAENPGNRALKELIRARERERDEIDRQIDALQ